MAATVTVACKVPGGLHLQIFEMEEWSEPVMGGGTKTTKRARKLGDRVTVRGCAKAADKSVPWDIIGGYGLTVGVDADFWNAWLAQNKDTDMVRNHLIFASDKPQSSEARAREQAAVVSKLEPIDPSNLPTEFRRQIATAPEQKTGRVA